MPEIRLLGPEDEAPLDRFLAAHGDYAQLMRANLRRGGIADRGEPYQGTYGARLDRGAVTAVAAHYWNGMVLVQAERDPVRVGRCALEASDRPLTGLLGPWDQVVRLSRALGLPRDARGRDRPQTLMALDLSDLVVPEPLASGRLVCRRARSSELELLYNWRAAFDAETSGQREDLAVRATARRTVDRLQADGDNWVLTRDGRLLATCTVLGETDGSVQIGGVHTPKDRRGRGYARAVVAGTLLAGRACGQIRATLFTDNPAAERAYRAIGFAAVGEVGYVVLNPAERAVTARRGACISHGDGVGSARPGRGRIDSSDDRAARPEMRRSLVP
jgi:RimJ/RimL family protein N-acetyltransferase